MEISMEFQEKLKIDLPYDLAISRKEKNHHTYSTIHNSQAMYQPTYHINDEWIKKMWYVDYRPKTNAVILDTGHTLRGNHTQEE
jgi:hypothetical protein